MRNDKVGHLMALIDEVEVLKNRLQPHDTGHIHTTINVLEHRITEVTEEIKSEMVSTRHPVF